MSIAFDRRAVLFDIDGTLMRAGGAGRKALGEALATFFGLPLSEVAAAVDPIDFRGATDAGILAEVARRLERPLRVSDTSFVAMYLDALEAALSRADIEVMPGVLATIDALERAGVAVGLLTGNIRAGAQKKLARIGLDRLVDRPGGFGEDGLRRAELARAAMSRLDRELGIEAHRTVVVGDTEHDALAADAVGACAVVVATGWTSLATLQASGAQLALADLSDAAPLWALLERLR